MNETIYPGIKPNMNTRRKLHGPSIDPWRCARLAACAMLTSLGALSAAHAASFQCPHNASASERLVCSDPALSSLDDKLAAVFREAHDATPDAAALDADRVTQWQWRQHNCKDRACVADWYTRRISELQADVAHGRKQTADRVKVGIAEQRLAPSAEAAVLRLKGLAAGKDEQAGAGSKVSADIGQANVERVRTVAAALPLPNATVAPNPCKSDCARRQVRIAF
ncbi:lipoprotein [Caballeronia glebae]|uniref:Lipoprotein n=2 Tax=Caballeronia glebae TaxID=1777143 RepID=A0A158CML3_9BURK|nr:lipoprotein [Caballeronia glebae]